jgi:drug/metabolite transporter (DMT)-like permease
MMEIVNAGEAYSALCALLWAIAVVFFRKSGEHVAPVALNFFKNTIGLGLFLITLPIVGVPYAPAERTLADWITLLASGAIGIGVADSLFFASLNRLGAGRAAIVDCLYSPFVIVCSLIYLGEPIGVLLVVAIAVMVSAILLGAWHPERSEAPSDQRNVRLGIALGVLSMIGMAVGIVMAKPVLDKASPWWTTTVRLVGGVALLSVQGALRGDRRQFVRCFRPARSWWVTMPAAVIGVYMAMLFWIMGMTYTHTTTASVLNQMSVIFILILATIFLREPLTVRKAVAIAMGFGGGVLAVL